MISMASVSKLFTFFVLLLLFSCKSSKIETIDFSDGSYEGEINKNKQKHGKGFFRWSDGSYYNGLYENDKRHGEGRFLWANGETYEGIYVQDKRTGRGIYRWSDGSMYSGSFFNGKRHGNGIFTSADGIRYEGEWLHDVQHGKGKLIFPNDKILIGTWIEGTLVSSNSVPPTASPQPTLKATDLPAVELAVVENPSIKATEPNKKAPPIDSSNVEVTVKESSQSAATPQSLKALNKKFPKKQKAQEIAPVLSKAIPAQPKVEELKQSTNAGNHSHAENTSTWRGTAEDVELRFITELINGLDTIKDRRSGQAFTGKMIIVDTKDDLIGELNLLNGVMHGKEIFYDSNGKVVEENTWKTGRKI